MDRKRAEVQHKIQVEAMAEKLEELFPDASTPQARLVQRLILAASELHHMLEAAEGRVAAFKLMARTIADIVSERYGSKAGSAIWKETIARIETVKKTME